MLPRLPSAKKLQLLRMFQLNFLSIPFPTLSSPQHPYPEPSKAIPSFPHTSFTTTKQPLLFLSETTSLLPYFSKHTPTPFLLRPRSYHSASFYFSTITSVSECSCRSVVMIKHEFQSHSEMERADQCVIDIRQPPLE